MSPLAQALSISRLAAAPGRGSPPPCRRGGGVEGVSGVSARTRRRAMVSAGGGGGGFREGRGSGVCLRRRVYGLDTVAYLLPLAVGLRPAIGVLAFLADVAHGARVGAARSARSKEVSWLFGSGGGTTKIRGGTRRSLVVAHVCRPVSSYVTPRRASSASRLRARGERRLEYGLEWRLVQRRRRARRVGARPEPEGAHHRRAVGSRPDPAGRAFSRGWCVDGRGGVGGGAGRGADRRAGRRRRRRRPRRGRSRRGRRGLRPLRHGGDEA